MCMLTFLPEGVLPNAERLRNGTVTNRDGHGWAIVVLDDDGAGTHILTGHSMDAEAAIEAFRLTREAHPDGPALFHSRYTTGGLVDEDNCHPYVVNGDSRTILAHNGILPWDLDQPDGDPRSDTRFFCDEWGFLLYPDAAQRFPGANYNLRSKRGRRRLSKWLGEGNKFVVLTVDPAFSKCAYLINGEQGYWEDDGCWYSNKGYLNAPYAYGIRRSRYIAGGWGESDDWYSDEYPSRGPDWFKAPEPWWKDAATSGKTFTVGGEKVNVKVVLTPESIHLMACEACAAIGFIKPLGFCELCGTCIDCKGDAFTWAEEESCKCLYPQGTHPARSGVYERLFGELESAGKRRARRESGEVVDSAVTDASDVVVTMGPPRAIGAAPDSAAVEGDAGE